MLPGNLLRREIQRNNLFLEFGTALYAVLIVQRKNITVYDTPAAVFPIAFLGGLNTGNFAFIKLFDSDIGHLAKLFIKLISIGNTLGITADSFDDNMILSCGARIVADFLIQDYRRLRFGGRHYLFCPHHGKHADKEANNQHRRNNTVVADTAGLHCRNLTGAGKLAKSHQRCQQHRHREGIVDNLRQIIHKQTGYSLQRSTVFSHVLRNFKQHRAGNKNTGESSNAENEGV